MLIHPEAIPETLHGSSSTLTSEFLIDSVCSLSEPTPPFKHARRDKGMENHSHAEDENELEEGVIRENIEDHVANAAAALMMMSQGTSLSSYPELLQQHHLVKSEKNELIPEKGRQIRNTPKEGDCSAFMNMLKMDDAEEDATWREESGKSVQGEGGGKKV